MTTFNNQPLTETIAPADQAEVADIVRSVGEKRLAIYPIGGGTSLDGGCSPLRPGIKLSTAKLNRVIDYPVGDMTVTVEAGVTIAELNKVLAEKRQWLPVDVAFPDKATVGGAIAVNAAGPRRFVYGTMRDYLLGFTAVDGTGSFFSGGGRVVKNAAGYNICRLMAGSFGMLGVITQATLMVRPLPEAAALLACEVPSFELAEKLLASLVRLPVYPSAVELMAGREHDGNPLFGPMLNGNVCRLCVGFERSAVENEWMLARLRDEWTSLGMTSPVLIPNLPNGKLWQWIAECPADATINVLPSHLVATIVKLLKQSPDCSIQARAGDGIICVKRAAGNMSSAASPAPTESDEESTPTPEIRVMRAIKERFDPANILNPGVLFA